MHTTTRKGANVQRCMCSMNTYSNRRVANHLHGLIFELKERMNSRQDRPVMQKKKSDKKRTFSHKAFLRMVNRLPFV